MKKIKIGFSFLFLLCVCLIFKRFVLIFNYFIAIAFHELAHLLVATKRGYKLKQVKLDMFGMSVELQEKIDNSDLFAINIAGPLCNLLLCLFCFVFYFFIPKSISYLNVFCLSNFVLAIFNLLPIYPLDGSKLLQSIIKNQKTFKFIETLTRYSLIVISILLFVLSKGGNLFLLIFVLFLFISKTKTKPTFSILKNSKKKLLEKVVIIKVEGEQTLFELIKLIKQHHYTIFYINDMHKYLDEDEVIKLATIKPLDTHVFDL